MKFILFIAVWMLGQMICAQAIYEDERYVPETDPVVLQKLEQWQDLKFGLLMHWGHYSQWGIVESWSICAEDEDWCRRPHEDYVAYKEAYHNLQKTFDPVSFDPEKWALAAENAGMKYVVFTTKHHDGFSMFDSKYTDYKVTSPDCPFHTNLKPILPKRCLMHSGQRAYGPGLIFRSPTGTMRITGGLILQRPTVT